MALSPRSGSLPQDSLPSDETPVDRADVFDQTPIVRDVSVQRNAFNAEAYPKDAALIAGYLEGSRITVTYYRSMAGGDNQRSSITDLTAQRDNISIPLEKITNFEITVPSGFNFNYDPENSESTYGGEGITYPGFNPKHGELFLYALDSGTIGLFQINAVEPLSFYQERTHRINFALKQILTPEMKTLLDDRVQEEYIFDKTIYFSSNKTLLTESTYTQNRTLIQLREVLINYYYREFYKHELDTIISPAGVYDPYLVRYLSMIVSFRDIPRRARQLYPDVDKTYRYTLWSRLLDDYNLSMRDLARHAESTIKQNTYLDVGITALLNRPLIIMRPDLRGVEDAMLATDAVSPEYVLKTPFYDQNTGAMSPFEVIVYTAITQRKVLNVPELISDHLDLYHTLTPDEQYYRIPIMIRLIDIARGMLAPNTR